MRRGAASLLGYDTTAPLAALRYVLHLEESKSGLYQVLLAPACEKVRVV